MLRSNIKFLSFILLPIMHILIPLATFFTALIIYIPWFASVSFIGFPFKPWRKIRTIHVTVWKKFVTDVNNFFQNYGHPSGIPMNWDGSVYSLPVDPIGIILSIFMYIFLIFPITFGVFIIFTIKAIPIFLGTVKEFWKSINLCKSVAWYRGVLTASEARATHTISVPNTSSSGHTVWSSKLKSATKGIKEFIEGYAHIKICDKYLSIIKNYVKYIEKIDPNMLLKLTSSYIEDFSPKKLVPSKIDISLLIVWLPILLTTIMWIIGLILVVTIPPATFLVFFLIWLLGWLLVISLPPMIYIAGWIFIIFGLPILYILLWCLILVGPWLFVVLGSVPGPLLALKIPYGVLIFHFHNPVEIWSNIIRAIAQVPKLLKSLDRITAKLAISKVTLIRGNTTEEDLSKEERCKTKIDYWSLYIARCIKESSKIQILGWLSQDDIMAATSTSMIAIPGVTIIAILLESIKWNKKEKTLIYWNEENKCREQDRDITDNVSNLFWPQIMKVKEAVMSIESDLDTITNWASASLCDGEDEKSEELRRVLEDLSMDEAMHQKALKIRAMVENIVHSLLRVNALTSRLHQIFVVQD